MALEFQVKKTGELNPQEIAGLARLFEGVFGKPCPPDLFERKFARSCLGYSIHSLMFIDGELIGAFSAIPVRYRFFGRTLLFALPVDLMIDERHRGALSRIVRLAKGLYKSLASEGVAFVFACLRQQIFRLHQLASEWRSIGKVYYYAAPFHLPYPAPASALARVSVRAWNRIAPWSHSVGDKSSDDSLDAPFEIEKVNDAQFAAWRYGIFPSNYTTIDLPGGAGAIYATELYYPIPGIPAGVRPGLLIDVFPLTKANFDAAVLRIRRQETKLTFLAYQGILPFQARDMFRIPARYEKQPWILAGRILNPAQVDERVFDARHWNINLSNGDVV